MEIGSRDRRARIGFGIGNLAVALLVAAGVFRYLPTRWWVVDVPAAIVALLLASSGVALLAKAKVAEQLTRIASGVVLILGLILFTALVTTAGWIGGVYGSVGASGAVIFGLVAALVLPYIVVFPAAALAWIGPRSARASSERDEDKEQVSEEPAPAAKSGKTKKKAKG